MSDLEAGAGISRPWVWGLLVALLGLLLSIFSAGFFLVSALTAAGLMILAVALASFSLAGIELRRSLTTNEIEFGGVTDAALVLANTKRWPAWWLFWREQVGPGLDVEGSTARFASVPAAGEMSLSYRLHSTRRGLFRVGPAVVEASGPFGLVRRLKDDGGPVFLTVLPRVVPIGDGWPLGHRPIHEVPRRNGLFEDPARFQGVRAYRPGDSLRRVHWRATARSGELQVKVFEPAVLDGALLVMEMGRVAYPDFDPADELPDPRVELAVTAAASLAEFVLAGEQMVGLLANGGDAAESFAEDWQEGTLRRLDRALAVGGKRQRRRVAAA